MNVSPHCRVILAASATLALGWALGFLMAGSPDPALATTVARLGGEQSADSPGSRKRNAVAEGWFSDAAGAVGRNGDSAQGARRVTAGEVAPLMRGALRLPDFTDRLVRLREIARGIPLDELPEAVEMAKRLPNSERWSVMQVLGARWAEADPLGAAEHALKAGGSRHGWNQLLQGVIEKWTSMDQDAALAWIGKQPEARQASLMQSVVQAVARENPEAALKFLSAQTGVAQNGWLHDQIFEQWAKRDPAGAAKAAEGLSSGGARDRALRAAAASWAGQDPRAAIEWAESFEDKNSRNKLVTAIAHTWAELEPKEVIQWAGTVGEPLVRQQILSAALSQLAQADAEEARAQLRSMPAGQERDNLVVQVANAAANADAKAAMMFLDFLPEGNVRINLTATLAMRLAHTDSKTAVELFAGLPLSQSSAHAANFAGSLANGDLEVAREWVAQLSDPLLKKQAARSVANHMSRTDPRAAAEWLLAEQPGVDLSWLVNGWVRNAPSEVLAWSKDLPDGEAKRSAQAAVVLSLAQADVQQARQYFMKELSAEAQTSAASNLALQMANRDLPGARAWAEALPVGAARENALGGIARAWALQDASAAAQWIEKFAPGDERDRVVTNFAGAISPRDPSSALAWAASISDPELRGTQVEQLASRWLQSDAAAAREWIENSDQLSPGARRRVLQQRSQSYYNYGYDQYLY